MTEGQPPEWDVVQTVGQGTWDLVVAGRKLADLDLYRTNAVPFVPDWSTVSGAVPALPVDLYYEQHWNGDGPTRALVRLHYTCLASYRGHGAFIPDAWLEVADQDPACWRVAARTELAVSVRVHGPENVGTHDDPVAALGFSLDFHEHGPEGEAHRTYNVWVYADARQPDLTAT
jgi:hypothetical protein